MVEILNFLSSLFDLKLGFLLTILVFIHFLFLTLIIMDNFIDLLAIRTNLKSILIELVAYIITLGIYLMNMNKDIYFMGFLIGTLLLMIFVNVYRLIVTLIIKGD